uniref:uncharacterized protein LOC114672354 isoform X2 n=1 Tax=Macaca mulatta TaxID=9544 RepID=UPI0010A240D4|nr:uncharacterized protein LOC114672354 isoform X2 [Macaca mulatta]
MPENMGCKGVPGTLALLSEPAPPHRKAEEAGGCRENVGGRSETDRPWSSRPSARETRAHRHRAHTRRPRLTGPSGLSRQDGQEDQTRECWEGRVPRQPSLWSDLNLRPQLHCRPLSLQLPSSPTLGG